MLGGKVDIWEKWEKCEIGEIEDSRESEWRNIGKVENLVLDDLVFIGLFYFFSRLFEDLEMDNKRVYLVLVFG